MNNVAQPQTTHKPTAFVPVVIGTQEGGVPIPPRHSVSFPLNDLRNAAEVYVAQGGCVDDFEIIPTHIDAEGTPRGFVRGSNYRAVEAIQAGYAAGVRGAHLEEMTTTPEQEGWWATRKTLGTINVDAVKIDGHHLDRGAFHRAIAVARELCAAGQWDGIQTITIFDPYVTHNKVFGVAPELLKSGVDYVIVAPVIPNTPATKYQIEEDGDILWA